MRFCATPLAQFAQELSRRYGINIVLDEQALHNDNPPINPDYPVTLRLKNVTGETMLAILKNLTGIDWTINNEALVITTRDETDKVMFTKVYAVRDLIEYDSTEAPYDYDYDQLINIIQDTVGEPTVWRDVNPDGGTIEPHGPSCTLVIRQTRAVHDQIEGLLAALRQARGTVPTSAARKVASAPSTTTDAPVLTESRRYALPQTWNVSQVYR